MTFFCVYTDPQTYGFFINWLNEQHPTITFTVAGDQQKATYLDTQVFLTQQNTLAVRPFKKATDKNTYLHFKSFHSRTLRHSIPYGQFLRIRRNSTCMQDYVRQSYLMQSDFLNRGYPESLVIYTAHRAQGRNRQELLADMLREKSFKGITTAVDFTPLTPAIKKIIFKHWHLVNNIPGCEVPPRIGLRKMPSIKDIVTRSNIREKIGLRYPAKGHFKCGACSCCEQAWEKKVIDLPSVGFKMELEFFSNTRICIYMVQCFCGMCYIRSTRRKLKVRMIEHKL